MMQTKIGKTKRSEGEKHSPILDQRWPAEGQWLQSHAHRLSLVPKLSVPDEHKRKGDRLLGTSATVQIDG